MPENAASYGDRRTVASANIQHNVIKLVGPSLKRKRKRNEITGLKMN
jgi:hypothetical protein